MKFTVTVAAALERNSEFHFLKTDSIFSMHDYIFISLSDPTGFKQKQSKISLPIFSKIPRLRSDYSQKSQGVPKTGIFSGPKPGNLTTPHGAPELSISHYLLVY